MQNKPEFIVIHHSAGSIHDTVESLRAFHVEKRGWSDIGYHRVILNPNGSETKYADPKDLIHQGRPDEAVGAHCLKYNARSIGICLVGNFEVNRVPEDMYIALEYLIMLLSNKYNIPLEKIKLHKELYATLCPGQHIETRINMFRKKVTNLQGG